MALPCFFTVVASQAHLQLLDYPDVSLLFDVKASSCELTPKSSVSLLCTHSNGKTSSPFALTLLLLSPEETATMQAHCHTVACSIFCFKTSYLQKHKWRTGFSSEDHTTTWSWICNHSVSSFPMSFRECALYVLIWPCNMLACIMLFRCSFSLCYV